MRYVFFGTPEFAAIVLDKLIEAGMPPITVICNPDRPVGRKKIITPPATKLSIMRQVLSIKEKIRILQPEKLEIGNWKLEIAELRPEFGIVSAYGQIIPQSVIDLFPRGIIGVHPSLLPKYRGASPIQSAILAGEARTGVTLYLLDKKMDAGPVLTSSHYKIADGRSYLEVEKELAELGGNLLIDILPKFLNGEIKSKPQNDVGATYTKKFTAEDGFINPPDLDEAGNGNSAEKAAVIERKIRALNPEPGVWTTRNGKRVKLLRAKLENGKLKLAVIQTEGKKPQLLVP